ncbi:MAG TPA: 1,4-alpha-glucan branching protein GlgB, partial [Sporolactobacillaceae bacterium]|nr:1,4-alpha-glucan branching protein GlgB [Sporolactobacillaceae bacterium]
TLYESYKMLGAHLVDQNEVKGVRFTVWAPRALNVSVVGNFNQWDHTKHVMTRISESGLWALFVPGLKKGEIYKYAILTPFNEWQLKADPYAFFSEIRPQTASVVWNFDKYDWRDKDWLSKRKKTDHRHRPMLIYEVHLGTWRQKEDGTPYTYRELAHELVDYVVDMGYTHIELMPVMEHPYDRSWGYQLTGYYSVTSRYGAPEDFMYFVDQCHQNGIGVILDWVPVHFCKDDHGLRLFDGTPQFEPEDPLKAERPAWGTSNFDLGKPEVISFLISNLYFWLDVYHIDGFRVDAVSHMIYLNHDREGGVRLHNHHGGEENLEAIAFVKKLNEAVFKKYPDVLMMAEEATAWPLVTSPTSSGGLGFNYKWNMGWVHDVLKYMSTEMNDRPSFHHHLTFSLLYTYSENFILPFSHDEVVYGKKSLLNKMAGTYAEKFANNRLLFGFLMTHPGKKLTFMGSEFGQFDEWKDQSELDWMLLENYEAHKAFQTYVKHLNHFYRNASYLWRLDHEPDGFHWIDPNGSKESVIAFIRKGKRKGDYAVVVFNFSKEGYETFRLGVPAFGTYQEVFNSNDLIYGGTGGQKGSSLPAERRPYHNQPFSMEIELPPLSMVIFKKETKKR